MRKRLLLGFLATTVVVLLLIGTTGCNSLSGKTPLSLVGGTVTREPSAAIFVSKKAPVMVSMLVNPDRLEGDLSKLKTSLLANTRIDYRKDIQPWLGNEITLAVTTLDIDRDPENGRQLGYLMALTTNQPEKSREFVNVFFSQRVLAGANLAVEQYKGVKLIYENPQLIATADTRGYTQIEESFIRVHPRASAVQNHLSGAVVGDRFVLFANEPKVLRDAINNVQAGNLNLTSSSQYQQATKQVPKGALAVSFLNLPIIAQWQGLELPNKIYDSQIISLVSNPKGLLTETAFLTKEDLLPSEQLSKPVGALQYIPASAGLAISGSDLSNLDKGNLAQLWQQVTAAVSGSEEDVISRLVQPLTDIQKRWDINLREDIFNWVQGEYAIALLPHPDQTTPDWIFVVEKSDATPAGISGLDHIATSHGLSLSSLTLGKQQISSWTELTTATTKSDVAKDRELFTIVAKVRGVHTTQGNYEIITNSIEVMDQVLNPKENPLIENPNFQDSIAAIPQPNQGYIYIDWTKSQQIIEHQLPILKLVSVLGKSFFHNLRSLTVSSYGSETGILKGGVFFELGVRS
ncbi:MAG: DUF3352 domain-containing protein [Stigonema ocellatum SAG 48.90 = DSM 106950]|nr:DUF3352 domain-containing protein [Stigonema ocellatum SAG 48.90 = DSM 106950]